MPLPPSVTKINKSGVTFTSNVNRVNYTLNQLMIGALKDVGKVLRMKVIYKAREFKGFKRVKRGDRLTKAIRYHVDFKTKELFVGFTHNTWYGVQQELGTRNQPKKGILRGTVAENIPLIVEIESKYLSALKDEATALRLAQKIESDRNDEKEKQDNETE